MTAQFPTSLVTTTNIPNANPATSLSANNHSGKHDDMRDEIIALETKVGINGSAVTTTHDYKLSGVTGSDKAVGATQTVTVTNKTLGTGTKMGLGSDATGDTYYNSGSGTVSRLGIGSSGQALLSNGSAPYWGSPSSTNTNYASDTGTANAYVVTLSPVPGAYTAGMLVQFKASNANTTTSTVNVNGLGVKTIKKLGGATDLASGDIASGMIVELEYDGTNFLMLNPVANQPASSADIQVFSTAGTNTWTKPSGAKWVEVTVIGGGGAGGSGPANNNSSGGGGGAYGFKRFSASALGSTESYTVGAGGVAGANNTAGGAGGFSSFGTTVLIKAPGGSGGGNSAAAGGVIGNGDIVYAGGASSTNGGSGVDTANVPSPRGGGAGGYNAGTPASATAGGNGGAFITNYVKAGGAGGAAGVNNGVAGSATNTGLITGGVGGGGGGYNGNGTNTGGNGAAGGSPGGGGGGSCGTNNVGGNGGDGLVAVVSYF